MAKSLNHRVACGIHGCKAHVSGKNELFRHAFITHTKGEMSPCCAGLSPKLNLVRHLLHHHCGKNKFRCTGPECTWGANTKSVFTRHLKRFHANATSSSSMMESTTEPISHSATSSTRKSRTEVPTGSSLQQPDAVRPPATLSHDAPVTSPDHCFVTPSALPQTTYEWIMEGEESTIEPPSSWYSYPALPPVTVSSTISTLPSVASDHYVDVPSSSSNIPSYSSNTYPDGIQAQSPSRNIPVGTEDQLWAPSSRFFNFPQGNPYPHYTQVTEQQHLDANPAQSPDGTFGAVLPQVDGGGITSPLYDFWSEAPYSSGVYQLGSSPDTVAYTGASNAPDSATNIQSFGYQYAPQYVDSVPRGLSFAPVTNGLDDYYQAQEATTHSYYQYEGNYSNMPPQVAVNGSFVAGDQAAWDGVSTNAGAYWNAGNM
ncbi:hypothetical protein EV421DRAFT_1735002 [Armillaria borealis]|uniref:C2H2-type domain-containing protein n=1 Tax=Armillaria borealis TaxID=47425 RepID=A0AA39MSL8_9AGAR|nr:hypothetical protein EV421DRAFT_1735002 [Armillaria borealis]